MIAFPIIQSIERNMQLRRYSESTVHTYIHCLRQFFDYCELRKLPSDEVGTIQQFLHKIVQDGRSKSLQNQYINAIKYYLEHYLHHEKTYFFEIERPKKDKRLPKVLSRDEVRTILNNTSNMKHRIILSLLYAQGLRVGEALNLRITDVNSPRMILHIRSAKGNKDRDIPLSGKILDQLRAYYKVYRPKDYLFEGASGGKYSQASVRQFLKRAVYKSNIRKHVTTHMLRHSYATHLLESRIDIRYIKELLGHNNIRTTEIYTHVTTTHLSGIPSPFDSL